MKILFCDDTFSEARTILAQLLPEFSVDYCSERDLGKALPNVDIAIPLMAHLDSELLTLSYGRLRLIQQYGVGLERVDKKAASELGILVANVPADISANSASVVELVLWFMIGLVRRLDEARVAFRSGQLGEPPGDMMFGKTVGVVGLGHLGRKIAIALKALGMKVMAVRRHPLTGDGVGTIGLDFLGSPRDLDILLTEADFLVLCVPLTSQTRELINKQAVQRMKKGIFLVNVGRGPVIQYDALLHGLSSGRIAGAGLDVFWEEPMRSDDPLFSLNVIATPHIGGLTHTSYRSIGRQVAENVRRLAQGIAPLYCVNGPGD